MTITQEQKDKLEELYREILFTRDTIFVKRDRVLQAYCDTLSILGLRIENQQILVDAEGPFTIEQDRIIEAKYWDFLTNWDSENYEREAMNATMGKVLRCIDIDPGVYWKHVNARLNEHP